MIIPLSPVDFYFLRRNLYTIQSILEFNGRIDEEKLRTCLGKTLPLFPALLSRLEVQSNSEAVLRVLERDSDRPVPLRVTKLRDSFNIDRPEDRQELIDTVITAPEEPLFKMVLGLSERKSFLSVSLSHLLGDGSSLFQFLISLSATYHDRPFVPPSNDRTLLYPEESRAEPVDLTRLFAATGYIRPRPAGPPTSSRERILFSNHELYTLHQEADAENLSLTTNQVLMAELLRRFYRSITLHENRLIVRCPVDYRRIHPNLRRRNETYFGNAVCDAVAVFDPEEFPSLLLKEIATWVRDAIRSIDARAIEKSLACLRDLRKTEGLEVFEDLGCPGLLVSNLSKMPLSKLDYGCGPPLRLIHASLNPRLAAVLPHADGLEVQFQSPA